VSQKEIDQLEIIARLMDAQFVIPGTKIYFGLDPVLGAIPVVGDKAGFMVALYMMYHAHKMGFQKHILAMMLANATIDYAAGSIPIIGDIFDVAFKAHMRNVRLMRKHAHKLKPRIY
jgi:hypothetical protein